MKNKQKTDNEPSVIGAIDPSPQLPARRPPSLLPAPDSGPAEWPTNFDLTTEAGRAALINASNPADWIPSDGEVFTLLATHYIVMPDEVVDRETGEIRPVANVTFVDAQGRTARFRNDWTPRRLNAMLKMYPPEAWTRGIQIECRARKSRQPGRTFGEFRIVPLQP